MQPCVSRRASSDDRPSAAPNGRLPSLTGLRFIAASTILVPHVLSDNPDAPVLPTIVDYLIGSGSPRGSCRGAGLPRA